MRPDVAEWIQRVVVEHKVQPPVLEVGSFDVNGSIRPSLPSEGYVGLDMREGQCVDMVADILEMKGKLTEQFNTVASSDTLEHVTEPWLALEVMYDVLKPGGLFIGAWVFAWNIHEYPGDYYRVTPQGFEYLLRRAGFDWIDCQPQGGTETMPIGTFALARKGG